MLLSVPCECAIVETGERGETGEARIPTGQGVDRIRIQAPTCATSNYSIDSSRREPLPHPADPIRHDTIVTEPGTI
jgi:hypothetical protein